MSGWLIAVSSAWERAVALVNGRRRVDRFANLTQSGLKPLFESGMVKQKREDFCRAAAGRQGGRCAPRVRVSGLDRPCYTVRQRVAMQ
jgi:hypothetical protein